MRKFLIYMLLVFPFCMYAQTDSIDLKKVLPVPEENGKVVFSHIIKAKQDVSKEKLFGLMEKWAKDHYKGADGEVRNRVVLVDSVNGNIACLGDKLLVFEHTFTRVDEANMLYQLFLEVNDNQCKVVVEKITYRLFTGDKERPEDYLPAEEMITDEQALNKKGEFKPNAAKFRIHTINYINSLFTSVDVYLNGRREVIKETKGAID